MEIDDIQRIIESGEITDENIVKDDCALLKNFMQVFMAEGESLKQNFSGSLDSAKTVARAILVAHDVCAEPTALTMNRTKGFLQNALSIISSCIEAEEEDLFFMVLIVLINCSSHKDFFYTLKKDHDAEEVIRAMLHVVETDVQNDSILTAAVCVTVCTYSHVKSEKFLDMICGHNRAKNFGDHFFILFNRGETGVPMDRAIPFLLDVLRSPHAERLVYPNDMKVIIDCVFRELGNRSDDDPIKPLYIESLGACLMSTLYEQTGQHLRDRLKSFMTGLYEDENTPQNLKDVTERIILECGDILLD